MNYFNSVLLKDGISLDLPYNVDKFFSAPRINFHDKYVEIDATPNFKSLNQVNVDETIKADRLREMFAKRELKKVFSYINDDSVLNDPKLREQIEGGAPPAEE
jgi:hypothetical protein